MLNPEFHQYTYASDVELFVGKNKLEIILIWNFYLHNLKSGLKISAASNTSNYIFEKNYIFEFNAFENNEIYYYI